MHTVIKGTKSIAEYKELRAYMEKRAIECFQMHKQALEIWKEGEIEKVWIDSQKNLCIEYESGNWWHYNDKGEWW